MISRIWHGWTSPSNADPYARLLCEDILPGIAERAPEGYRGAHLLRHEGGEQVEFVTVMWFDTLEDVRAFAGDDYETAVVPERAQALLARYDLRSRHYDTVLAPPAA